MKSERARRISVDLDNKSRFKMLKTFLNLKGLFPNKTVTVQETFHGYHVKVTDVDRTVEQNLRIRRALGDDGERLEYDESKHRCGLDDYVDVLFSVKAYPDNRISVVEEVNVLAEPFYSEFRRRKI